MDFLNQALAQVRELFRSMTPGARLVAGLLLAAVVVSVGFLFNHQYSGADAYLMGGEPFPASSLPAMEAAFSKAGLAGYSMDGNRVRVPRGQQAAYMAALADNGALPPNFGSYLEKALDADNPFLSKHDKLERLKVAKQNELSLILRSMQGVENASVIYDIKEQRGLGGKAVATASVNIKPVGSEPLDGGRIPMIRHLVASAIAGLDRSSVTVTDLNGRAYPGGDEDGSDADPSSDAYFARKKLYERELRNQVLESLSLIPGVLVQVSAELDPQLKHIEESTHHDPKTVPVRTREEVGAKRAENSTGGGRPGLAGQGAQGPAGGAAAAPGMLASGRTSNTDEEKTVSEVQNLVNVDHKRVELKGLIPRQMKVTVVVPSNYYRQVWQSQNKPAEGQPVKEPEPRDVDQIAERVKKDIENTVVQLLPPAPAGVDKYPLVSVTSFQSLDAAPLLGPSVSENAVAWLGQHWSTLGLIGLAGFSLVTLRSVLRAVPSPAPTSPGSASTPATSAGPALTLVTDDGDEAGASDEPNENRLKRRIRKGPNLKDDLLEMVREDPDSAATILRSWIGNAS